MPGFGSARTRYAIIGWAVTRFGWPMAKRAARQRAGVAATDLGTAARRHPARTSIAIGAIVGGIGWVIARAAGSDDDDGGGGGSRGGAGPSGNGATAGTRHQGMRRTKVGTPHQG